MKTLFVSDLDGTLLRSNERTSQYTNDTINHLVEQGVLFSYATARSFITAQKVTAGMNARIPLIVYNGAMVIDNTDNSILLKNFFDSGIISVLKELFDSDIFPIVYAFVEGKEKFSFIPSKCTGGMNTFLDSRKGDVRTNAVQTREDLYRGDIFYITCIDSEGKLRPFYEKYKDTYHCVYQVDIYTKEQWLEIMPKEATKANAIKQLKEQLGCDRLVVFGDGKNDIDMFQIADEAYAVSNAVEELKAVSTAVIGSNDEDGVAKWLENHMNDDYQE